MANIAFIGLGNMGGPMAANLVKAGHKVIAFDLVEPRATRPRPTAPISPTARVAAVKGADVVITMLPAGKHVLSVWNEVIPSMKQGALIIDCSTIDVASASRRMRWPPSMAWPRSMRRSPAAPAAPRGATLTLMCGGEDKAFAAAKPVLENMGKKIVHCGGAGAGQAAKICNNMILGISMIAVGEAFALAEKLGLSHQALFDVASTSSGQCWALTSYCPVPGPVPTSPANNDYKPGFASALMVKDLTLAQDAAKAPVPRRRWASTRRKSTRRSTPPDMAGWIFPGSSSSRAWRNNARLDRVGMRPDDRLRIFGPASRARS
jgi:3-hydroxyisobutyrate dehydrogenase